MLHDRQGRQAGGEELEHGLLLPGGRQRELQGVRPAKHRQRPPCVGWQGRAAHSQGLV